MNLVALIGRLTRDLELKFVGQNNTPLTNFTLAVDRPFKQNEVDFINCVAFAKTAEIMANHLGKGRQIGIEGRLQVNNFEKDGEKRQSVQVVVDNFTFCDSKGRDKEQASNDGLEW